jgi:hypothetical protein
MSAEEKNLVAAFQELETGETGETGDTSKPSTPEIVEEVEEVVEEVVDYAKILEDEIDHMLVETDVAVEDKNQMVEEEEHKQEAKEMDVIEEEPNFETLEELQQKLRDHARGNYLLLAKVRKYDTYIKQLIEMVDRLGARLKYFGLDHYF